MSPSGHASGHPEGWDFPRSSGRRGIPWSAARWKEFYRDERGRLGEDGIAWALRAAPRVELPARGALIFPHTRFEVSGHFVAAVALALVRARVERVLAIGVLHGARETDAAAVRAARAGDAGARATLRRVHGPGAPGDTGCWVEEFSLDAFAVLLEVAARREGVTAPHVIKRFPFLVGDEPWTLPGLDEARDLVAGGAVIVATADPVHHGAGYDTPEAERLPLDDATCAVAKGWIDSMLQSLADRDFAGFARACDRHRADFRDVAPVIATLIDGAIRYTINDIVLVDYAEVLDAPPPTWVAAPLTEIRAS